MSDELATINPETKAAIDSQEVEAKQLIAQLATFEVQTPQQLQVLSGFLITARDRATAIENAKTAETRPLNERLTAIRAIFAPAETAYDTVVKRLKELISAYHQKSETLRTQWQAALAAAKDQTEYETAITALRELDAAPATGSPDGSTVGTQRVWAYDVTDPALIPDQFWCLDSGKIKEAIAAGQTAIPGLTIFQKVNTVVRKRRGKGA